MGCNLRGIEVRPWRHERRRGFSRASHTGHLDSPRKATEPVLSVRPHLPCNVRKPHTEPTHVMPMEQKLRRIIRTASVLPLTEGCPVQLAISGRPRSGTGASARRRRSSARSSWKSPRSGREDPPVDLHLSGALSGAMSGQSFRRSGSLPDREGVRMGVELSFESEEVRVSWLSGSSWLGELSGDRVMTSATAAVTGGGEGVGVRGISPRAWQMDMSCNRLRDGEVGLELRLDRRQGWPAEG